MLLLAAISCMMVANPGTPDSKKKKKKENAVCDGSLLLFLLIPNCCALKKYKMCRKKD